MSEKIAVKVFQLSFKKLYKEDILLRNSNIKQKFDFIDLICNLLKAIVFSIDKKPCFIKNYILYSVKKVDMLRCLYIQNIVLIENASINFEDKMNCITGDSGSGKSVILESIGVITGERASQNLIKEGCDSGIVCAEFDITSNQEVIDILNDSGYKTSGELIIKKIIKKDSSRIFINEVVSSVNFVKDLMNKLINIHGQTDQFTLLNQKNHINILDDYIKLGKTRSQIAKIYDLYKENVRQRDELKTKIVDKTQLLQDLKDAKLEIEKYNIQEGEEDELVNKRIDIIKSRKLIDFISNISNEFGEINLSHISGQIVKYISNNKDYEDLNEKFEEIVDKIENVSSEIEAISSEMSNINNLVRERFDYNIDEIEERIDIIKSISSKYKVKHSSVFDFLHNINLQIDEINGLKLQYKEIDEQIKINLQDYHIIAEEMNKIRSEYAVKISHSVNEMLHRLDMTGSEFKIDVVLDKNEITRFGSNSVSFVAKLNNGSKFLPINEVASGGEMSRIILAIKASMLDINKKSCMFIFDEIETGLSSNITIKVARELSDMSSSCQIIAITHNPYIAGIADSHIKVSKTIEADKSFTSVANLNNSQRLSEIAGMISANLNDSAISLAKNILSKDIF